MVKKPAIYGYFENITPFIVTGILNKWTNKYTFLKEIELKILHLLVISLIVRMSHLYVTNCNYYVERH